MKLTAKILLIALSSIIIVLGGIGVLLVSGIEDSMRNTLLNSLAAQARLSKNKILTTNDRFFNTAESIAKNRAIPRALDLFENRGVNQVLNDQVKIFPNINYIIVFDIDGFAFSSSTINADGRKINGEQLLSAELDDFNLIELKKRQNAISRVEKDPYFDLLKLQQQSAKLVLIPITKRGEKIGSLLISFDWQTAHNELLGSIVEEFISTGNPIYSAEILNQQQEILAYSTADKSHSPYQSPVNSLNTGSKFLSESLVFNLDTTPTSIALHFDKKKSFQPIEDTVNSAIFAVIGTSALLALILFYAIRSMVISRIAQLRNDMYAITQGELETRNLIEGKDEISQLGISTNHLVESLLKNRISIEQLNGEVELKQEALSKIAVREKEIQEVAHKLQHTLNELREQKFALDQHSIVAITDLKGNITFANRKFCEIAGYSEEELLGQNHRILNSGQHDREFWTTMYRMVSKGKTWHAEVCNINKAGDHYWVDTTIVPFMNGHDKPESYIAIQTDITQNKKREVALIKAKEAAEVAAQAKSEFLASMSHEIRTPMNGVLGMLGLLLKENLNEKQRHKALTAQSSATSLLTLINDILDFSKVDAGKLELESLDFDLRKMLGEFSEAMALQAHSKNLELVLDVTQIEQSKVKGDPGRLRQILTNIVGNAIKFTHEGEIIIRAGLKPANDGDLIFYCSIKDTGIGIAKDKQGMLFDTFTQADSSTTREFGGTGLGLSIVKRLCELMGGSISLFSEPGQGSCFEFTLTLMASQLATHVIPEINMSKLKLLVVDDNKTNREVLIGQLSHWGASIIEAEDGPSAMNILQQRIEQDKPLFDIALLDMQMPGMDGAMLGKAIKSDPRLANIKLVMMTSISDRGDAKYFADLGFDAYFPKPATTTDLFDALAVVAEGGDSLLDASPLVTHHYLQSMDNRHSETNGAQWPLNTRLLLVEDNQINQMVAQGVLEGMGLKADIAANGREALDALSTAAKDSPYTLVLMDCQMPEMDGFEASLSIRTGKAGRHNQTIPIIAMTANAMEGDKERCLEAGMSDYLSKPIDPAPLEAMLIKWLK